jgi:arylsulfatase A-like enzyme/cytochrome c-type biogenesis protein CcmH/NrfG
MRRVPKSAGLLLLITAALPEPAVPAPPANVLLISIDTLRADHLGCYGYRRVRTPHLDALARGGTLVERAETPVPMTMPAHTSLMTSTYPFVHGVEENGQRLAAGAVTLAGVLKARGYETAAFIGGYVLDARFGLNQGFDVYDSPFHLSPQPGEEPPEVKRPAEAVLEAASRWLGGGAGRPKFAFVHLYDLHQPYSHGSYDGELAYVDEAVGRFLHGLEERRVLEKALIVLTSDHGESLGEHGEDTHGYFIYESTLWVPLILHWPAGSAYPARAAGPASLLDVAPTVLDWLGVPAPPRFQGRSLLRLLGARGGGEEPIYAESMYARDHLGCSPLRAIRLGRYKLIDAPKPELYDLAADPREAENLYDRDRPVASKLKAQLDSLHGGRPRPAQDAVSPEVLARLRSLGYLSGRTAQPASGADPKDRLPLYRRYGSAIRLANTGRPAEAAREFQAVLDQDGRNLPARYYLAVCWYRLQRLDDAVRELGVVLAASPNDVPARELLGTIRLLKHDYARAAEEFTRLLEAAPEDYGAHFNLGVLAMRAGRREEAERHFRAALAAEPDSEPARKALGELLGSGSRER